MSLSKELLYIGILWFLISTFSSDSVTATSFPKAHNSPPPFSLSPLVNTNITKSAQMLMHHAPKQEIYMNDLFLFLKCKEKGIIIGFHIA